MRFVPRRRAWSGSRTPDRHWRLPAAQPIGVVAGVCAGTLLVGGFTALPAIVVAATVVGPAALVQTILIIKPEWVTSGSPVPAGLRRGTRWLGLGVLLAGLVPGSGGLLTLVAPDRVVGGIPLGVGVPLLALLAAEGAFLFGLLGLSGLRLTPLGRLRRTLDGAAMGTCGFFVAWLLLFAHEGTRGAGFAAILLSCVAFCGMVVAGVRVQAGRAAALACGAGIALAMVGMTQTVVALDYHGAGNRFIGSGLLLLVAPLLIGRVTRGDGAAPTGEPVDEDTNFGGYPLFGLPLAAALLAWVYRFVQRHTFDSTSIALALAAVVFVTLRGSLASFEARRYAHRLTAREAHFRSLFAGSSDVIMVLGDDLTVRWQSPASARQLGLSDQDVVGASFAALVHPDDADQVLRRLTEAAAGSGGTRTGPVESRLLDGFNQWRDVEWQAIDHRAVPAVAALVVHLHDIGERKQLQRSLHRSALVDQLTGLPNRRELGRALTGRTTPGVLIVLRLTGITDVNEARGHGTGDTVMVEAARRVREIVTGSDLPVRLEGQLFAVLTDTGAVQAQFLATRLVAALVEPYPLPGGPARLSADAGLAELTPDVGGDELLRRAELALRRPARWETVGAIEWYDESLEATVRRQFAVEQALPGALGRGEFDLRYQPVVDLRDGRPVGVEVVLRWRHPDLGTVPTEEFLPVAEQLGLAGEIEDWVLGRSARALSGWVRDGHDLWLSLDVTVEQLDRPSFLAALTCFTERHPVPASRLVLEVAEPGLAFGPPTPSRRGTHVAPGADARAAAIVGRLVELRALGARIALDRFGAASTSLSRLRTLPVDLLKIEWQLYCGPGRPAGPPPAIIDVVVRLGRQLGMDLVVQGLDSETDLDAALAAGCRYGQGDVLCRPVPAEHLEAYLEGHRSPLI